MKQVTSEHINDYLDFIMDDYVDWCGRANIGSKQMSESKWVAEEGRKYIKIIHEKVGGTQRSVHSFIVKEATKKFGVGDVLMAASWKALLRTLREQQCLTLIVSKVVFVGQVFVKESLL